MKVNLATITKELHNIFDLLNGHFYNNELPQVIITVQSKGKTNSLGWFTPARIWEDGTSEGKHEINISAESLNRHFLEIINTMHHEMIHLYCAVNGIKDTSRGNTYHNKKFKAASEQHGFYYKEDSYHDKYGWTFSSLTDESIKAIYNMPINQEIFSVSRKDFTSLDTTKKSNIIKWVCECGVIIRTSKDGLNIACLDCGSRFEKEEREEE